MRFIGTAEIIVAIGAAVFAFVVAISNRVHKTKAALISSICVSLVLLAWDRYLYVSTSKGLLDTLTCWFTPTAKPCQEVQGAATVAQTEREPTPVPQNVAVASSVSPRPLENEEHASERAIVLDDRNARSIWATSVYSYAPGGGGPGGGLADERLRVGGWGDTYVSLIMVPVAETGRSVRRATLVLSLSEGDSRTASTPMRLMRVTQRWGWSAGDRLWWRNVPTTEFVSNLPAPSSSNGEYEIELTGLYNQWALGERPNFGIMLAPILTNNNFNTFASTRAQAALRPRLRLIY